MPTKNMEYGGEIIKGIKKLIYVYQNIHWYHHKNALKFHKMQFC